MNKEERLKKMTIGSHVPEHGKVAADLLEKVKEDFSNKGILVIDDKYWPYHVIAAGPNVRQLISIYCKGFRRTIEVQVLTVKGLADHRYKEVSFATPKGAANYVLKLQAKWRGPLETLFQLGKED